MNAVILLILTAETITVCGLTCIWPLKSTHMNASKWHAGTSEYYLCLSILIRSTNTAEFNDQHKPIEAEQVL